MTQALLKVGCHAEAERELDEIAAHGSRGQKEFVGRVLAQLVTAARSGEPLGPGKRHGGITTYSLFYEGVGNGAIAVVVEYKGKLTVMAAGMPETDFDPAIARALTRATQEGWK